MKPTGKAGTGLIQNYSGDRAAYMGHFRSSGNMKEGHNRGNPGKKMTMEPGGGMQTPAPQRMNAVKTAQKVYKQVKKTGGAEQQAYAKNVMQGAKKERKEAFKSLGSAEKALAAKGYGGGRGKAVKEAKGELREKFHGAFKQYKAKKAAEREDKGGGLFSKIGHAMNPATYAKKAGGAIKKYGKKAATGGMA